MRITKKSYSRFELLVIKSRRKWTNLRRKKHKWRSKSSCTSNTGSARSKRSSDHNNKRKSKSHDTTTNTGGRVVHKKTRLSSSNDCENQAENAGGWITGLNMRHQFPSTQSVKLQRYTITPFSGDYKDWLRLSNQFTVEVDQSRKSVKAIA